MPVPTLLAIDLKSVGLELAGRIENLLLEELSLCLIHTVADSTKIAEELEQYSPTIIWVHMNENHQAALKTIELCARWCKKNVIPIAYVIASAFSPDRALVSSAFESGAFDFCDLTSERNLMITGLRWEAHLIGKNKCLTCGSTLRPDFIESELKKENDRWKAETGGEWVL